MAKYLPSSSFCFIMDLNLVSVNKNASSLRLLEVNMNVENPPSCNKWQSTDYRKKTALLHRLTHLYMYLYSSNYVTEFFKNGVIYQL